MDETPLGNGKVCKAEAQITAAKSPGELRGVERPGLAVVVDDNVGGQWSLSASALRAIVSTSRRNSVRSASFDSAR